MKNLALAIVSLLLAGCGNFNSIHRDLNTNSGVGALVDIKQRAIIVGKRIQNQTDASVEKQINTSTGSETNNTTNNSAQFIVCAEPSPDALSAYVAEFAAKGELPNGVAAQLSGGTSEGAAFTGLRTYGIQVLRDAMYQNCQAHMNGALSPEDYAILARRNQRYMVALLAIEQLTGAVKAPPVIINTSGSAEAARSLSEMRSAISSIDSQVEELKTKLEATTSDDEKKKISSRLAELEGDKKSLQAGIEKARAVLTSQSTTAQIGIIPSTQNSTEAINNVANSVKGIVEKIFETADDVGQVCIGQVVALSSKKPNQLTAQQTELLATCQKFLNDLSLKPLVLRTTVTE